MVRLMKWSAPLAALLVAACGGGSQESDAGSMTRTVQAVTSPQAARGSLLLPAEQRTRSRVDTRLLKSKGSVDVWVQLEGNSMAAQSAEMADAANLAPSDRKVAQRANGALRQGLDAHRTRIHAQQASVASELRSLGGRELARLEKAHNAIAIRVDAAQLSRIAALSGVVKVRPVMHYKLDLSETVPYVGGAAVQARGFDGTGVTVAVLDSGIDYTHRNFGGAGTDAAYAAAYGSSTADPKNTTRDGLFPTAKVVDGFDFVGEQWPNCDPDTDCRSEDPDPIDLEGHGTHVADIIAGRSADGTHKGMAPGAKLVAVKVCSAVATTCNGIALLKGMEFALDPNGDGNIDDAVDVINMSLGSDYGQAEDDLTLAAANAVKAGVVVVTSAGNGSNMPYKVGSPSIGLGVISVAQTQVPSAVAIPLQINAPAAIAGIYANTETVDWAPIGNGVTGDVAFVGRGCPAAGTTAADAYLASPAGKIALIDRGSCSVSLKVDRAAKAGAVGVLIGLVAAGDAVSFSNGGGTSFVPTMVITLPTSNAIKTQLKTPTTVNVSLSPSASIALVGGMAGSSSRGPSIAYQSIKPEIGAPGASRSAVAGSGNGEEAFGGTSGAAPMVSGAAALLVQAFPNRSPAQIKAMLMNSAETVVYTNRATAPGVLAPITRIGAGELRVDRALKLNTLAWNKDSQSAALSFGAVEAAAPVTLEQTLRVDNLSRQEKRFTVTPSFRYAADEASGAVRVVVKSNLRVGPGDREELDVKLIIDPTRLPAWPLNGGPLGGRGDLLDGPEFDGYITLTAGTEKITVPWHVLPRKAADASSEVAQTRLGPTVKLRNRGLDASEFDVFSLLGTSKALPRRDLPKPGDNFAAIDLRAVGARYLAPDICGEDCVEFAISTFGRRPTPLYPAEFDVYIDVDLDGVPDFVVFNSELNGFGLTGQNVVNVVDLATGLGGAVAYADVDLNSGNVIMTVPMAELGVAPGQTIAISVDAVDNYFTGFVTDTIEGMRFTPGLARFGVVGDPFGAVPARSAGSLGVTTATIRNDKSSESGLLMMYRRNADVEADLLKLR